MKCKECGCEMEEVMRHQMDDGQIYVQYVCARCKAPQEIIEVPEVPE